MSGDDHLVAAAPEEIFGANVRRERRRQRLSQEDLSHISGLHSTEIGRLERAVREPRLSTIVRLARALRIPPGQLLDDIS